MLFTIAVILLVLWLLGLVSGYTLGNFIYVLLVIALGMIFKLIKLEGQWRVASVDEGHQILVGQPLQGLRCELLSHRTSYAPRCRMDHPPPRGHR